MGHEPIDFILPLRNIVSSIFANSFTAIGQHNSPALRAYHHDHAPTFSRPIKVKRQLHANLQLARAIPTAHKKESSEGQGIGLSLPSIFLAHEQVTVSLPG